jgi:glucose/arabinose dehydrogenase
VLGLLLLWGCAREGDGEEVIAEVEALDPRSEDGSGGSPPTETDDPPGDAPPDTPDLRVELRLTEVATMTAPTAGALGPDGRLYLAERSGTLHVLTPQGVGDAVLDLSAETTTDGERGLLGVAFASDGRELYLSFTDLGGDTVVEAFAVEDGVILGDQRRTVFTAAQPYANHNGGDVRIGPDGLLYLALGDGGGSGDPAGNGQDLGTPLGALLRIDPQGEHPYTVPADNPFVADDAALDEIWAYGLRNPWRFSFDRATGELYLTDVGEASREEINWFPPGGGAGANLGWNLREGTLEFAGPEPEDHVPPIHEYETRGPQGCAITGGAVYRGAAIPELVGAYLFSDLCAAQLRAIVVVDGEVVDEADLGVGGEAIVSFVEDADGELYVLDFGGAVRRIDPA